jgi:aminoglycoside phosphotransferase (APT) family kinase protein
MARMPDFLQVHTQKWLESLGRRGYPGATPLAAGVEGAIYDLGDGTVAKVWGQRHEAELILMQNFYADIASAGLPFATPEILAVEEISGTAVTFERKLPGRPLQAHVGVDGQQIAPGAARCVIEVLRSLSSVPATPSMRQLPVLDEDRPLWAGAKDFQSALLSLLQRRVSRFGNIVRSQLRDFDLRYARLREKVAAIDTRPDVALHGDLVPSNILVDQDLRPLSVLDFGFLTTAGDPCLDAAIAAAVTDMYGPHALQSTRALTAQIADDLSYPADTLLLYQAAYAVATSNAFTADGSDGHFAWCVRQLARADVTAILLA